MNLSVKMDIKDAERHIWHINRRHIPYAVHQALNDTAFQALKAVRAQIVKLLHKPIPWTVRGVLVQKSRSKRDLSAAVFISVERWKYLQYQVEGGIRMKDNGGVVAIPTRFVKRNKYGNPVKSQRPKELLKRPDVFSGTPVGGGRPAGIYKRGHAVKTGRGKRGGSRTVGAAATSGHSTTLIPLYIYKRTTSYRSRFPFRRIVVGLARNRFRRNFDRRLQAALRSAR